MKASLGAITAMSLLAVATQSFAAPPWKRDRYYSQYDRGHAASYEYARVVDVDPIYRQVSIESPRQECWEEIREVRTVQYAEPRSKGPMILGGIIGGVLGHQIGSGRGNDVATVAGTLIGASVAQDAAVRRAGGYSVPREQVVERCVTRVSHHYEERIDGYEVTYKLHGREYTTRMPYDPGERIRVRVDVEPVEY